MCETLVEKIAIEIPPKESRDYYLTLEEDRKFFPVIECVGKYQDGLRTGTWIEYYGNGAVKSEIDYLKGVPFGKCTFYWGNGIIKQEFSISSSDSVKVSTYNDDGSIFIKKMVPKTRMIKVIYEE